MNSMNPIKCGNIVKYGDIEIDTSMAYMNLHKNKYPLNVLALYLNHVDYRIVLKTQHLTAEFCAKYIMDPERLTSEEKYYMDISYICNYQPHISSEELEEACIALGYTCY